jgi:prepilin peptidase CpaA
MYFQTSIDSFLIGLFFGLLTLAAYGDIRNYRIPNWLSLAIAALYPVHVLASNVPVDWIGAVIVTFVVFVLAVVLFVGRVMGGGDVKLIAAVALWAGPAFIADFIVVMALSGALLAIMLMSPLRHGLALAFEKAGNHQSRDAVLAKIIPYGLAIAVGGYVVGLRLMATVQV